jgi:hypothetical protein
MDVHSHIHESYARTGDERRHYGLSPLSSTSFPPANHYDMVAHDLSPVGAHAHAHHHHHHHHSHNSDRIPASTALLNDLSMARQTLSTPSQYTPPSTMMHASYDPVHGIYGIARMASNNGSSASLSSYTHDNYARSDRPPSSYGQYTTTSTNDYHEPYARTSSISPLDDQRRERPQLPSPSELEWPSYKASLNSSSGGQNVHSFRVQGLSSNGDMRPATYSSGSSERSTTFPTISPSPALAQPTAAAEETKPSAKRIVMACHQWCVALPCLPLPFPLQPPHLPSLPPRVHYFPSIVFLTHGLRAFPTAAVARSGVTLSVPAAKTACGDARTASMTLSRSGEDRIRFPGRACGHASQRSRRWL